ncbi:MAG: short-chain alcohol dehydrogenase [Solirubrobacterales bacterium]|nr:short-chain alcohol dehydrogenase [Solirubrobacterales bacterium]
MPSVLLTGASRGIGQATALKLAASGWEVFAGVRRPEDGAALVAASPAGRITALVLDVTDSTHVAALQETLPERVDALVNNAGIVVPGPVEGLTTEDLRRQLEVNVVGQVAVTQALLPRLRASRGRVVFISSIGGRVSAPMMGAYSASKFALEALADALRVELRRWGVRVVLIEPGAIDTDLWRLAPDSARDAEAALGPELRELYADHLAGIRKTIPRMQKQASPVDRVADAVERALSASRPRARYLVGTDARVQAMMGAALPTRATDAALSLFTGMPSAR